MLVFARLARRRLRCIGATTRSLRIGLSRRGIGLALPDLPAHIVAHALNNGIPRCLRRILAASDARDWQGETQTEKQGPAEVQRGCHGVTPIITKASAAVSAPWVLIHPASAITACSFRSRARRDRRAAPVPQFAANRAYPSERYIRPPLYYNEIETPAFDVSKRSIFDAVAFHGQDDVQVDYKRENRQRVQ